MFIVDLFVILLLIFLVILFGIAGYKFFVSYAEKHKNDDEYNEDFPL